MSHSDQRPSAGESEQQPTNHQSGDRVSTRLGAAWSEAACLSDGSFRVRLGGPFQGAWLATLCTELAGRQISIEHTHARRTHQDAWIAELHVVSLSGAPDPRGIPYLELANTGDGVRRSIPALDTYRIIESRDYGGSLQLTFEAEDALGLLGSLLMGLAELGLLPVEIHVETRDGRALDSLWLKRADGEPPGDQAVGRLERFLAGLVRSTSSP